jgi:oligoribonuclease
MIDRLVWIDLEMTGLDPATDVVLEVAALVTDSELEPLGDGVDMVIGHPQETLDRMGDVVREMHAKSGLTDAVLTSTVTLQQAEQAVLDLVKSYAPDPRTVPLCGNSIATDRTFITAYMPALEAHLHYRMIDVSSIKELARRWYPKAYYNAPVKGGGHRALADILESVAELRYYREAVFKTPDDPAVPADPPTTAH